MEASQEGLSDPQDQPTTASEQGVSSDPQDQPTTSSEAAVSQEEPTQDSGLQTPQPVPTEDERQVDASAAVTTAEVGPSGQPAEGNVAPASFPSSEEQQAQADQQAQELEAAQREHNERTGGGEVQPGELQAQRDEHNARVGGGVQSVQAPAEDSAPESEQA